MDGVIIMRECIEFNNSTDLSAYADERIAYIESYDESDTSELIMEMFDAYVNELNMYQEGQFWDTTWDTATGAGKDENVIIKILKFIPRLIMGLGKAISNAVNNKKVEEAAEKIEEATGTAPAKTSTRKPRNTKTQATKKKRPTTSRTKASSVVADEVEAPAAPIANTVETKSITIDRAYFDQLENSVKMFIKYSRHIPNIFTKLIKNTLETGKVPYARDFQAEQPINWDFRKKQKLITASGEKADLDRIGPRLTEMKRELEAAAKAYRGFEADFKKNWESILRSLTKEVKGSKVGNGKAFIEKVILPNFTPIASHVNLISQAVAGAILEVGNSDAVTESFYFDFDEESAVVEYMI